MTDVVKILRAFNPGDIVFLEYDKQLSAEQRKHLMDNIKYMLDDSGIRIVLLEAGMRVVSREEFSEPVTPDH